MTPRLATFLVFGVNGAMIGTWIAHLPWLQDHLEISKSTLGLCLLCMAAGALIAMPVTGQVVHRRSSACVTRWTTLLFCLLLPLPLLAGSAYVLGAILFVFGALNGAMEFVGKRYSMVDGDTAPSSDGPSASPAAISPMTWG